MKILIIGFGSIGQGIVPLLRKHFSISEVNIITAHKNGFKIAQKYNASISIKKITRRNYKEVLKSYNFDILINVSVDVSSVDLINWCQTNDRLYIDTCVEPWKGGYENNDKEKTTNYYLRQEALKVTGKKTAIISHGANPGLISHLVKAALDELKTFFKIKEPNYAKLAYNLGIKVVQVAERDTQFSKISYDSETFVNTWSVDGFISEIKQYAELGTSEDLSNLKNYHAYKCSFGNLSVYLDKPGYQTKVKSWVPSCGNHEAYLVTHHEATSISNMLSYKNKRPTVYFAYMPCKHTVDSLHLLDKKVKKKKILRDDIISGSDEMGALLVAKDFSYWFGSILDYNQVSVEHNSATSLQVTIAVIAGIAWMLKNPNKGIIEAEDIDHNFILDIAKPYLGHYGGTFTDFKVKSLALKDFLI